MKRILAGALAALLSFAALAATTNPVSLLNPSGSTAGQAVLSTGPTTAPVWGAVPLTGISGTLAVANGGTGATSAANARTNLGLGTSATVNTGTSGATIPLLNGTNTWAAAQTFSVRPTFNGATPWDSANLAAPAATTGNLSQFAATTSAQLAGVVSDETGSGALVFGTTPTLTAPNIVGTISGGNAAAGSVGEYVSASVSSGSAVALTAGTAANITSISLTAGDWDVSAVGATVPAATTTQSNLQVGISTTSATQPSVATGASVISGLVTTANTQFALGVPTTRINVSSTTTVYLVMTSVFATSTNGGYGAIRARRVR